MILDNQAKDILPKLYGTDLGAIIKPGKKLILKIALWHLYSQQEFVYVGDASIVEPSGKTRRMGTDVSARYQFEERLFHFDRILNVMELLGQLVDRNVSTSISREFYHD